MTLSSESGSVPGRGILDRERTQSPTSAESVADENILLDRLARARLRVLDSTIEGIYQIDPDGRCTFMNRAACCMLGYQFGAALRKKIHELHHGLPDGPPVTEGDFSKQALSQESREDIFRRTDGSTFPVECWSQQVFENERYQGTVVSFRDITERKRVERRLKAQHAVSRTLEGTASIEAITPLLLRSLGESLQFCWGALWQVDEKDSILRLSNTWHDCPPGFEIFEELCRTTVFSQGQDLLGKVWASGEPIWISDLVGNNSSHCAAAARAGFRSGFAIPIRMTQTAFGVIEFFTREYLPLDTDLLGILGLLGTAIGQVIERKRSESVQARLAAILDAATDFVGLVIDPGGMILSASWAVENIFGFTPLELVRQPLNVLIPEYRHYLQESGWSGDFASSGLKSGSIRMRGRRKSGESIPLEASFDECIEGGSHVIAAVIRDVTERAVSEETLERQAEDLRRSEEALRHQTRLVNSIVTSMADGVIAADENGEIVLYNPAAISLLGEQMLSSVPDENTLVDLGHTFSLSDQRTPCPADQLPLNRAVQGETVDGLELFVKTSQRPEGFWMNGTARPMIDADGELRGGVLVFRDVTEQKAAREALRRAKDEAETANRAKSEFLSRMSHELRTPMNAILGFAQLLEDEALTPEQRDAIARILKAARHLLGLINEVLDISRIEAGRLNLQIERLQPFEVVQSAIELMAPLVAQRGIELVAPAFDGHWSVTADRQRLTQVLVNLLGNAVKYNRESGEVRVSFEETKAHRLRIRVADTGFGIAPEQLSKLFVPFERLGAERSGIEGTGLGLAHSNRLISAMSGTIGVESEVGKGSVFWIEIPLSVDESRTQRVFLPPSGDAANNRAGLDLGLAKVLYIQDDPTTFREIETIFSRLPGYGLVSAEQGRVGLTMALEHAPELVLLDLQLPDMEGIEVLRELRSQMTTRQTPIVVVTAELSDEMKRRALDAGAHSCIAKPIRVRDFLDTIACLI